MSNNWENDLLKNIGKQQTLDIPKQKNNWERTNNGYKQYNSYQSKQENKVSYYANVRFELKEIIYELSDKYLFIINNDKKMWIYKNLCRFNKERNYLWAGINFDPKKKYLIYEVLGEGQKDRELFLEGKDLYQLLKNNNRQFDKEPFANESFELNLEEI